MLTRVPSTLIHRLFLAPYDPINTCKGLQCGHKLILGKRIKLFDANKRHVFDSALLSCLIKMVVDLTGTKHNFTRFFRINFVVPDGIPESTIGELFKAGNGQLMAQNPLGAHNNEGASHRANSLATQQMKYLRRGRWQTDLDIVLSTLLQKPLQAS